MLHIYFQYCTIISNINTFISKSFPHSDYFFKAHKYLEKELSKEMNIFKALDKYCQPDFQKRWAKGHSHQAAYECALITSLPSLNVFISFILLIWLFKAVECIFKIRLNISPYKYIRYFNFLFYKCIVHIYKKIYIWKRWPFYKLYYW